MLEREKSKRGPELDDSLRAPSSDQDDDAALRGLAQASHLQKVLGRSSCAQMLPESTLRAPGEWPVSVFGAFFLDTSAGRPIDPQDTRGTWPLPVSFLPEPTPEDGPEAQVDEMLAISNDLSAQLQQHKALAIDWGLSRCAYSPSKS